MSLSTKLHAVELLWKRLEGARLERSYRAVIAAVGKLRRERSAENFDEVSSLFTMLEESIAAVVDPAWPSDMRAAIEAIDRDGVIGERALSNVALLARSAGVNPDLTVRKLEGRRSAAVAFGHLVAGLHGFLKDELSQGAGDGLGESAVAVQVVFRGDSQPTTIEGFEAALKSWARALRVAQRLTGASPTDITLRTVERGSIELTLELAVEVAGVLLEWFKSAMSIAANAMVLKKLRDEMQQRPRKNTTLIEGIDAEIEAEVDAEVDSLATRLCSNEAVEAGERNELKNAVRSSTRDLLDFAEAGGRVRMLDGVRRAQFEEDLAAIEELSAKLEAGQLRARPASRQIESEE